MLVVTELVLLLSLFVLWYLVVSDISYTTGPFSDTSVKQWTILCNVYYISVYMLSCIDKLYLNEMKYSTIKA